MFKKRFGEIGYETPCLSSYMIEIRCPPLCLFPIPKRICLSGYLDVDRLKILPEQWEVLYDAISEF